jgi:hypothetical protein
MHLDRESLRQFAQWLEENKPVSFIPKDRQSGSVYFGCTLADFGFAYVASSKFQAETAGTQRMGASLTRSPVPYGGPARTALARCSLP